MPLLHEMLDPEVQRKVQKFILDYLNEEAEYLTPRQAIVEYVMVNFHQGFVTDRGFVDYLLDLMIADGRVTAKFCAASTSTVGMFMTTYNLGTLIDQVARA